MLAAALAVVAAGLASIPLAFAATFAARPFVRASTRYRVLLAAFALTAAVGPLAFGLSAFRDGAGAGAGAPVAGTLALAFPLLAAVAAVAAALLAGLGFDVVKLRRVKRSATVLGSVPVRNARLGTSPTVSTPTAIGYVHPAVVVPVGFRDRVDAGEWDAVVAHECAHLARLDDWAKGLQSAVTRAGWWMPGLWILGRALDLERELASDEQAARTTGSRAYAACLLRLATGRGASPAPGFAARRTHVAIRVERLLRPSPASAPVLRAAALGAATAAAVATIAAAVLAVPGSRIAPTASASGTRVSHAAVSRLASTARAPHARPVHPAMAASAAPAARRHATQLAAARPRAVVAAVVASAAREPAAPPARAVPPAAPRVATREAVRVARYAPVPHMTARGRAAPSAGEAPVDDTVIAMAPVRRCLACVPPFRSPDVARPDGTPRRTNVPSGGSPAAVAIAADDGGPVTLSPQMLWARMPIHVLGAP